MAGDSSLAVVGLAAFVTTGAQAEIRADLAAITEPGQVSHFGQEGHRHQATDAGKLAEPSVGVLVPVAVGQLVDRLVELVLLSAKHLVAIEQALQFGGHRQLHRR